VKFRSHRAHQFGPRRQHDRRLYRAAWTPWRISSAPKSLPARRSGSTRCDRQHPEAGARSCATRLIAALLPPRARHIPACVTQRAPVCRERRPLRSPPRRQRHRAGKARCSVEMRSPHRSNTAGRSSGNTAEARQIACAIIASVPAADAGRAARSPQRSTRPSARVPCAMSGQWSRASRGPVVLRSSERGSLIEHGNGWTPILHHGPNNR